MGKSQASETFRRLGVAVFDADATVHEIMAPCGRGYGAVQAMFPGVVAENGRIDRKRLGAMVFAKPEDLRRLESVLHPWGSEAREWFLRRARALGVPLVVLDVPLLFETGGDSRCDYVAVVSAPSFVQRHRALRRAGMTEAKLAGILVRQTPDAEKRHRADFVIPTGLGRKLSLSVIKHICKILSDPGLLRRLARKPRGA
jgi:dephospho-CoA kinase